MNLHHIHYAIEIARYGSFNKAAANLFVSQPSLSRAIGALERELGFELFVRLPNGVLPTHQGQEFLRRAKNLNEQYMILQEQYAVGGQFPVTQLSLVACRCVIVELVLVNLYNRYRDQEYLNLCVCEERIEKIIDHVYDGLYAMGLIIVSKENQEILREKCQHLGIAWISLGSFSIYAQVGMEHPLAGRDSVSFDELEPYPRAAMVQDEIEPTPYGSHVHGYNPSILKRRIVINDKSTMYALLTNTDAYYIGLDLSRVRGGNRNVRYIPIRDWDNSYTLALLHLQRHTLTPIEKEMMEDIKRMVSTCK